MAGSRGLFVLAAVLAVATTLLLTQATASDSGPGPACELGAISAMGPIDEQGRGDTTPDVRCIEP